MGRAFVRAPGRHVRRISTCLASAILRALNSTLTTCHAARGSRRRKMTILRRRSITDRTRVKTIAPKMTITASMKSMWRSGPPASEAHWKHRRHRVHGVLVTAVEKGVIWPSGVRSGESLEVVFHPASQEPRADFAQSLTALACRTAARSVRASSICRISHGLQRRQPTIEPWTLKPSTNVLQPSTRHTGCATS